MCTLTLVTRANGYSLAMNRDEQLIRGVATPPALVNLAETTAIYPRDGAGGTWVAANSHGIALALLNWNDVPQPNGEKVRSRGDVIPALIHFSNYDKILSTLEALDLQGTWPFCLVGVFPAEKRMMEWSWTHRRLESRLHEWKLRHWFSSSLSDEQASAQRGAVCQGAWKESDAGSVPWLRRLHASHANGPGPFSLCVHRENVKTLSYTEIHCEFPKIACVYGEGSPCEMQEFAEPIEMSCCS